MTCADDKKKIKKAEQKIGKIITKLANDLKVEVDKVEFVVGSYVLKEGDRYLAKIKFKKETNWDDWRK